MDYPYQGHVREDILAMIPPDGRVIGSIGCGPAATEATLVKQGREVHGVDVAPEAIEAARSVLTSARLISTDDAMPFAENSLDGLILADVLEHIPQAWAALGRFAKAVRPGGWVVISVPNMRQWEVLKQFAWGGDWPETPIGIFDETHVQVMTRRRLARWCAGAGLKPEKWFDRYDPRGPRRTRLCRIFDGLTLKLFHEWFMFQLQVRCRRTDN